MSPSDIAAKQTCHTMSAMGKGCHIHAKIQDTLNLRMCQEH